MACQFATAARLVVGLLLCLLAAGPPGARAACEDPCSCAFGVDFGEGICTYTDMILDVRDYTNLLSKATPDFAAAYAIYTNGSNAYRPDGVTRRTMLAVTRRNYGEEAYYKLASDYFKKTYYLDDHVAPALRGDGEYASACCGVRAEVAKAGGLWYSAAFSLHEFNAGICYATGCNNKTAGGFDIAAEETLHAMGIMTGADPGNSSTALAWTLFQSTNAAAKALCTKAGSAQLDPINKAALAAWTRGSAEAKVGNTSGMLLHYATAEKTTVARFLQLSLLKAVDASKAVTRRDAQAATACHSPCIREAQQAAARTYFRVAEPIIARTAPALVTEINAILAAPSPLKTLKPLATAYRAVYKALGIDAKTMLARCKA